MKQERTILDEVYSKLDNLIDDFVNYDVVKLKNIYNGMNTK